MCGKTLVTKQTGEDGLPCNCVYVVEKLEIEKEFYVLLIIFAIFFVFFTPFGVE